MTASSYGLQRAVPTLFVYSKIHAQQLFGGFRTHFCSIKWKSEQLMGVGEEKKRQAPTMKSHDSKTVFELINTLYKSEAKPRQTTEQVI